MPRQSRTPKGKQKKNRQAAVQLSPGARIYFQEIAASLSMPLSAVLSSFLEQAAREKYQPTLLWNKHRPLIHKVLLAEAKEDSATNEQRPNDEEDARVPLIDLTQLKR